MQKSLLATALGFRLPGLSLKADSLGCGGLHYARLAGGGQFAYRCPDESCWLKTPAASEDAERLYRIALARPA